MKPKPVQSISTRCLQRRAGAWSKAAESGASTRSRWPHRRPRQTGQGADRDYVLEYRNTKLAWVEAKAWGKPLTEGVGQAKDYAGKLAVRFTYASNGQGIYGIDMDTALKPNWRITRRRTNCGAAPLPRMTSGATALPRARSRTGAGFFQGRYYQDIAVERVLAAITTTNSASC